MTHKTFYSSETADTKEQICAGVERLIQEASRTQTCTALLACDNVAMLDGLLEEGLKEYFTRTGLDSKVVDRELQTFKKSRQLRVSSCLDLQFAPKKNITQTRETLVLTFRPTEKLLATLFGSALTSTLIILPDCVDHVRFWLEIFGADDLFNRSHIIPASISDPVLDKAMENLWDTIGRTGTLHNTDRNGVIDTFRSLRHRVKPLDEKYIRTWLIRRGAPVQLVDEIADIAVAPDRRKKK